MQSNVASGPSPTCMNRCFSSAYRGKAESDTDIAAPPLTDPKATSPDRRAATQWLIRFANSPRRVMSRPAFIF